jgi:hypothetical protein
MDNLNELFCHIMIVGSPITWRLSAHLERGRNPKQCKTALGAVMYMMGPVFMFITCLFGLSSGGGTYWASFVAAAVLWAFKFTDQVIMGVEVNS